MAENLGEMWQVGVIRNWNTMNRFHCPYSGKKLLYKEIGGKLERLQDRVDCWSCSNSFKHRSSLSGIPC